MKRTMNRTMTAVLLLTCALTEGARATEELPAETRLVGEVVDMHCYLTRGARGKEHSGCANACIGRGVTPGFVAEDGKVYLLLAERNISVKDKVAGLAGERVRVSGTLVERDGLRGLQVRNAERLEAP
jgi:hypothetical protein